MGTVPAEGKKTIKLLLFICILHCLNFINVIVLNHLHFLKGRSFSSEYSSACGEYT